MQRQQIHNFQSLPNVGPAIESKLLALGYKKPEELVGQDPYQMYRRLCDLTNSKIDPCVIDIFISIVRYMEGAPAKKWWAYTEERKRHLDRNGL